MWNVEWEREREREREWEWGAGIKLGLGLGKGNVEWEMWNGNVEWKWELEWGMSLSFKRQIQHISGVIAMEISEIGQYSRIGFNSRHILMEIPTIFIAKSPNF